ncbi:MULTISPECIES: outer membrane lipid asymmetry maintenance protein MlaD [unclassified Bordetella]|uniref:outer membrane lipid asymmetry maintenance protein MlaD n=1 Tax=unclassified Bordetella TaxID=2630031 RepID=UPI0013260B2A|nr:MULTISPECIES: outer membrane lipid asymmetry maintenance protein MlaD [unclassified Bordetella]MVW72646.1 outer membrane lipid asymmetry maintenance protein MlaD [Bordetella sp. 15P40C-2]MVW78437.1 outer membrane lipid asymmetry maintenance protein MlaD [Bordetella sp. 02P26C-1]
MSREKTDFWVGLFILLGAVAVIFLALRAGNLSSFSFAPTYTLTADFDNIGGLKERAAVKSAGVVVGRVKAISFDDQTFKAVVTLNMEEQFLFPKDTSASILTSGLLGEQYIGLTAGGDEQNLTDGGKIRYTQSAVVLENLISQFLYKTAENQGSQAGQNDPAPAPAN